MSLRLAVEVVLSMIKQVVETDWLDFYPGGVPAGIIFDMQVEDACELVGSASKNKKAVFTGVQQNCLNWAGLRASKASAGIRQRQSSTFAPNSYVNFTERVVTSSCGLVDILITRKKPSYAVWLSRGRENRL